MLKEQERGRKEGGGAGRLFSEYVDKVLSIDVDHSSNMPIKFQIEISFLIFISWL